MSSSNHHARAIEEKPQALWSGCHAEKIYKVESMVRVIEDDSERKKSNGFQKSHYYRCNFKFLG